MSNEGPRDPHFASAGLAVGTAAAAGDDAIDLLALASGFQGVEHSLLLADDPKVLVHLATVDRHLAAAGANTDASDRFFPPSRAQAIAAGLVFFYCDHDLCLFLSLCEASHRIPIS